MIDRNINITSCNFISDALFVPETPQECRVLSMTFRLIPFIAILGWGMYRTFLLCRKHRSSTTTKVESTFRRSQKYDQSQVIVSEQKKISDRKEPYNHEEVMQLSEAKFKDHKYRIRILNGIEAKLLRRNYQTCVDEGVEPSLHGEEDVYIRHPNPKASADSSIREEILIHQTVFEFLDSLPGIDVSPYRSIEIREGIPLTCEEVMKRANKEFSDHKDKEEILKKIEKKLKTCDYERSLRKGTPPYLNSDGYFSTYSGACMPDEIEIKTVVNRFLRSLPGVDAAPYVGHRLK
jgi:hypothetical protein